MPGQGGSIALSFTILFSSFSLAEVVIANQTGLMVSKKYL
jgi:hypothetical protein